MYTKDTIFKEFNEETRKLSKGIDWEDYPFKVLNVIAVLKKIIIKKKQFIFFFGLKSSRNSRSLCLHIYVINISCLIL